MVDGIKIDPLANAKALINTFAGREIYNIDGWISLDFYKKQDFSWKKDIEAVDALLEAELIVIWRTQKDLNG